MTGRPRRPRSLGLRLDSLEPRDCPAVAVVQDRNVLHLTGDAADDVVVAADQGGHAVRVQTGGVAQTFTGVARIVADLAAGADTFEFRPAERPTESLHLRVDLGEGDNRFVCPEPPTGSPPPDAPVEYAFDLRAGSGDDVVIILSCVVPGLGFDVGADLGDGDNNLDATFRPDPAAPPRTSMPGISVAVATGARADTVKVTVGDAEQLSGIAMQKVKWLRPATGTTR